MKKIQNSESLLQNIRSDVVENVCEKRTFSARLAGEKGPMVVLLHGFPDTWQTFNHQIPFLVQQGYRVLVPVMPGYEQGSADPEGRYYPTDLVRWLISWLDHMGEEKVHLVGHDWGAVTAWMAAVMAPERFHSLTAIAIPSLHHMARAIARHPTQLLKSWYIGFFQLPGIPERALDLGHGWLIRRLWRNWSPGWEAPSLHLQEVCDQLLQPEVKAAALAYYRCLFRVWTGEHRNGRRWLMHPVSLPTLMISGHKDGCMDTRLFDEALVDADFPAGVELYRLMGAGHFCHLEKPDLVNRKIARFLVDSERRSAVLAGELDRQLG